MKPQINIGIVDYGSGNVGSILKMLKQLGGNASLVSRGEDFSRFERLIIPGVGAYDQAVLKLRNQGMWEPLENYALALSRPILGICLGMQLMMEGSEEGSLAGFGWFQGRAKRFPKDPNLKVPHMGWNWVYPSRQDPMTAFAGADFRFYFVHSFYIDSSEADVSLFRTKHGIVFDSGIKKANLCGVQFHPEKSHKFGCELFKAWMSS